MSNSNLKHTGHSPFIKGSVALHAASAVAVAAAPQVWPAALCAVVLDNLVLSLAGAFPRSRLLGGNVRRAPGIHRAVSLTFDDGPNPRTTPRILDLLDEFEARATFFLIGERAAEHPELTREIVARGHGVENHTFTHPKSFAFKGPKRLAQEIDRTQELLAHLAGRTPTYVRTPAGTRNPLFDSILRARDLTLVSWTRRGLDTVDPRAERVANRLVSGLRAGDILVLHDGLDTSTPVDALSRVLAVLRSNDLESRPLHELLP